MSRLVGGTVGAFALLILVGYFGGFYLVIFLLTLIGTISATYFLSSWGYFAVRMRLRTHHSRRINAIMVTDYVGFHVLALFAYTTTWPILFSNHLPPVHSLTELIRRVALYFLVVGVSVLRASRWAHAVRIARGRSHPCGQCTDHGVSEATTADETSF